VKSIYFRTQRSIDECRRRLEERVGKSRWRLFFAWFSVGLGRYCQEPLQGTVDADGFDVVETGPKGWGVRKPWVQGRWASQGESTIIRLHPYMKAMYWAELLFRGVLCGGILTFLAIAISGQMSHRVASACLVGFSAVCMAALSWLHLRQLSSLGKEMVRRFGVLFEAEPIHPASDG